MFLFQKTFVFGGVHQFDGQVSVFGLNGPCYRCIFRDIPPRDEMPSCAEAGVIGVVPGIIGLMQAVEAIKWICGIGDSLLGRLLLFDALSVRWRELKVKRDPECPLCGGKPTILSLQEIEWECSSTTGADTARNTAQGRSGEVSVRDLKRLLDQEADLYLLDVREQYEWDLAHLDGAHLIPLGSLKGSFHDIPKDKSVYCYCKSGNRSAKAIAFLKTQGYTRLFNIRGGIQAWSEEIDPKIPIY